MKFLGFEKPRADVEAAIDFMLVAALLVFASVWAYHKFISTPPYVDSERYPVRGIDVSSHNGMMNLDAAAKDGVEFIFIKASEGATFRDENFRLNYSKARHAGMKTGAYHFFRFDVDGVAQAVNFVVNCGIFFDISISTGDIGLRLVIIEVANEIMDFVIREKLAKFRVKLCGKSLIMR